MEIIQLQKVTHGFNSEVTSTELIDEEIPNEECVDEIITDVGIYLNCWMNICKSKYILIFAFY